MNFPSEEIPSSSTKLTGGEEWGGGHCMSIALAAAQAGLRGYGMKGQGESGEGGNVA